MTRDDAGEHDDWMFLQADMERSDGGPVSWTCPAWEAESLDFHECMLLSASLTMTASGVDAVLEMVDTSGCGWTAHFEDVRGVEWLVEEFDDFKTSYVDDIYGDLNVGAPNAGVKAFFGLDTGGARFHMWVHGRVRVRRGPTRP